jgi:gliding motility-associated protein GldM
MALPKEPRQKMINLMYLVLTALLALNVSSEILNAFKVVDASLQKSNSSIEGSNATIFQSLKDKLSKPETKEKADIWAPRANDAKTFADQMYNKVEQLKDSLKRAAGYNPEKGDSTFKEDDLEAATRLFITNKKGTQLLQDLTNFKTQILGISPEISKEFANKLPLDLSVPKSQSANKNLSWEYNYFHMSPTVAVLTILSKFENDIRNTENQIVTYCHNQIGQVEVIYNKSVALVSQSSNYVMPGQSIKVKAGVGIFSSAVAPTINIGGQSFLATEGYAQTEIAAGGAGLHSIPVTIVYKGQDGKDVTVTDKVEYVVGVPGGAAVMLDKMNVLYVGVDNPVTIGSPVGWDKTSVSMSGGSISGSGSSRSVRVSAVGAASITVTADGKSTTFPFRCKRIPNPIFKVGDGKARMASVAFKSQSYCRAELENFDFDLKYSVAGATVYFSGANFSNVATASIGGNSLASLGALIAKCGPGSVITFDNIRVSGPDGTRTIDSKSIALY